MSDCGFDKVKVRTTAPVGVDLGYGDFRMMQRYRAERIGLKGSPMRCDDGCPYHRWCDRRAK